MDAVNKAQLDAVTKGLSSSGIVAGIAAGNAVAVGAQSVASGINSTALGFDSQSKASQSTALGQNAVAEAEQSVALGEGSSAKDKFTVSVGNSGWLKRRITNVAAGKNANDVVIFSQFNGANNSSFFDKVSAIDWRKIDADKLNKLNWNQISSTASLARLSMFSLNSNLMTTNATADESATSNREPGNSTGNITTDANTTTENKNVVLNKDLTVKGNATFEGTATFHKGADMGGNKVTNVADGTIAENSKDAVNGGQLWTEQQARIDADNALSTQLGNLGSSVDKLDRRVDRVGAGAAALAALHPLDYDPANKWDFAAGYGNYKGASAVSIGTYYRPNENTMFSVGGSFGGGENMVNAGVSFKFGDGKSTVGISRAAMANKIDSLEADNKTLTDTLAKQNQQIADQGKQLEEQSATIKEMQEQIQQLLKAQASK